MLATEEISVNPSSGLNRKPCLPPLYIAEAPSTMTICLHSPTTPSSLPSIDEDAPLVSPTNSPIHQEYKNNPTHFRGGTSPTMKMVSPRHSPSNRPSSPIPQRPPHASLSPVFSVPPSIRNKTPKADAIPEEPFL